MKSKFIFIIETEFVDNGVRKYCDSKIIYGKCDQQIPSNKMIHPIISNMKENKVLNSLNSINKIKSTSSCTLSDGTKLIHILYDHSFVKALSTLIEILQDLEEVGVYASSNDVLSFDLYNYCVRNNSEISEYYKKVIISRMEKLIEDREINYRKLVTPTINMSDSNITKDDLDKFYEESKLYLKGSSTILNTIESELVYMISDIMDSYYGRVVSYSTKLSIITVLKRKFNITFGAALKLLIDIAEEETHNLYTNNPVNDFTESIKDFCLNINI